MVKLTKKQEKIYNIIKEFIEKNGYSPTVREIGELAELKSPATVFTHLETLEEGGYIKSERSKSRTIRILK